MPVRPVRPPQRPRGSAASPPPETEAHDGRTMATLFDLPDLVLLEIFSYLPVRDRIRISRCSPVPQGKSRAWARQEMRIRSQQAGVVLTAGPLLQGLSPLEEASG